MLLNSPHTYKVNVEETRIYGLYVMNDDNDILTEHFHIHRKVYYRLA